MISQLINPTASYPAGFTPPHPSPSSPVTCPRTLPAPHTEPLDTPEQGGGLTGLRAIAHVLPANNLIQDTVSPRTAALGRPPKPTFMGSWVILAPQGPSTGLQPDLPILAYHQMLAPGGVQQA